MTGLSNRTLFEAFYAATKRAAEAAARWDACLAYRGVEDVRQYALMWKRDRQAGRFGDALAERLGLVWGEQVNTNPADNEPLPF